jgi:hypothetical protein
MLSVLVGAFNRTHGAFNRTHARLASSPAHCKSGANGGGGFPCCEASMWAGDHHCHRSGEERRVGYIESTVGYIESTVGYIRVTTSVGLFVVQDGDADVAVEQRPQGPPSQLNQHGRGGGGGGGAIRSAARAGQAAHGGGHPGRSGAAAGWAAQMKLTRWARHAAFSRPLCSLHMFLVVAAPSLRRISSLRHMEAPGPAAAAEHVHTPFG